MKHYSLILRLIALLILSCMMFVPMVAAETTCSFINITQGPAGPMNQTPNMTAGAPGPDNDAWYLWINGTRAMTGNLSMGSQYINNLFSGNLPTDAVNKSYVDTVNASLSPGAFTSTHPVTLSNTVKVIGGSVSVSLTNDKAESINEISTNVTLGNNNSSIPTSGAIKSYVDSVASSYNATYDAYTNYNATYDAKTNYNASYITSTYNATYDTKLSNPIFGYVTLMAGSAMVATTNPTVMNQWETTTYDNNYISLNFTDGGTEIAQWIVDFPADWNSTGDVIFTPLWTAEDGSGTVNWTIAGKLFGDDAALDTAVVNMSSSVDTLITAGDLHVAPATTGAVITTVGTGNTAILKVIRDPGDTGTFTAQLLGLRIKYVTNKA